VPRGPCACKQQDITRALKGAKAAGFNEARVEIELGEGRKMVLFARSTSHDVLDENAWDAVSK
jgi:hypothetical protein